MIQPEPEGSTHGHSIVRLEVLSIEEDLRTYNEAMKSRDVAFWKEAIDDEVGLIMENNTWVLSDLPPGYKPLGCKWIFKKGRCKSMEQLKSLRLDWHVHETITITLTQNTDCIIKVEETPVSIRPSPAGGDDSVLSTQEYMKQVVEDVGKDKDFNSGSGVGVTEYVKANGGIVSSGVGGSAMLMEEEEIVKLVEEEEMADLELHVYGNVIDQEDIYKLDKEALDLVLEEEARESRAHEQLFEICR
nr:zinc finger, CCHC-type [Tanacetum cinerariifolium]